jgi:glycosyltransferase involved in cell wall biosynthesis
VAELTYIIPTYNSARTIERTILSIINQPGERTKIIVVDDGSTDDTLTVLARYKSELTCLRQPNAGPSVARNLGLQMADTEIVCFVDADDYVVGPHRRSMESSWNKDIDMIIGLFAEGNDDRIVLSNRNKYGQNATNDVLLRHFICNNWVQTGTICWSTEFLKRIGGWDEKIFVAPEDMELAMRAFLHNPRTMLSNAPCWVVYHTQPNPNRLTQITNPNWAAGQLWMHTKIINLIEKTNGDEETIRVFLERCMGVGRVVYLCGFHREAVGLFSIAWDRGYVKHNGPRVEAILTKVFGTTSTLSARELMGKYKRRLRAAYLGNKEVEASP